MRRRIELKGNKVIVTYFVPEEPKSKKVQECSASLTYVTVCGGCAQGC